jgi:hypothetical protein
MNKIGAYIAIALAFFAYNAVTSADRDDSGAIVDAGSIDAFHIQVGDCFDDSSSYDEQVTSLPGVPCSDPHDNEAFAVFDVTFDSFPDEETMSGLAYESCVDRFEPFVGIDYESSVLEVVTLYPTAESWAQDDREVVCALYDMSETKLVGSVRGRAL